MAEVVAELFSSLQKQFRGDLLRPENHCYEEARAIFAYARERAKGLMILPCYAVSDAPADTIVDIAATIGASHLIVGAPQRSMIVNLLRGNIIRNISDLLPEEIHLLVYA